MLLNIGLLKKGIQGVLSLNMLMGGMVTDPGVIAPNKEGIEEAVNTSAAETVPVNEMSTASDATSDISSLYLHDEEEKKQNEIYRCSIKTGEEISLKDILIESGCLKEEEIEDFLKTIKDVSVSDEEVLKLADSDEDYTLIAEEPFDTIEEIVIQTEEEAEVRLNITDRSKTLIKTVILDDANTGSFGVTAAGDSHFEEDAEIEAEFTANDVTINAVVSSTPIYADYYTFHISVSEEKEEGYEVSIVFPQTVKGNDYRLFHVENEEVTEIKDGTVDTTGEEGDPEAAGFSFYSEKLGEFVFACTKTFEYEFPEGTHEYEITGEESIALREILVSSGIVEEDLADVFLLNIKEVTSDDPAALKVELINENECVITPANAFETQILTVVMNDGNTGTITVKDGRVHEEPTPSQEPDPDPTPIEDPVEIVGIEEAVSYPTDFEIDSIAISATEDKLLPQDAESKAEVVEGTEAIDIVAPEAEQSTVNDPESFTEYKVFEIDLENVNKEEYESFDVELNISKEAAISGGEFKLYHILDDGTYEEIPVTVNMTTDENGNEIVDTISFTTPSFSEFVLMYVVDTYYRVCEGETWKITADYDAETGIPSNAKLIVSEISESDERYAEYVEKSAVALGTTSEAVEFARAFDIHLMDPQTGEMYQPSKDVKVTIELLDRALNEEYETNVVHIHGEANELADVMDITVNEESVEFETDGFSIYVYMDSKGAVITPQCTYTFWVPNKDIPGEYEEYPFTDDQGNPIFNQIITSGEELVVPSLTSTDEEVFSGWHKGDRTGGTLVIDPTPYDFDNITITENSAVDLYAVFKHYTTVVLHDQYDSEEGIFPVEFTVRAELTGEEGSQSAVVKITDLSLGNISYGGKNMGFLGWSYTEVQTPGIYEDDEHNPYVIDTSSTEGCITVTEETHLYPIFKEIHILTFYAAKSGEGAAYNGPRYLFVGDSLDHLPITSLSGKTFIGWYTGTMSEDGKINYGEKMSDEYGNLIAGADDPSAYVSGGKLYLRADTTLYAKWADTTSADYRIIYWKQLEKGSDYVYAENKVLEGTVGEEVSVSDEDKANDRYEGYHLKEDPASAVVKADGSTVLNVYYDHDDGYTPAAGSYTLSFVDSVTEEGKSSENLPQVKSVEAGTSLADQIIEDPVSGRKGYSFSKWYLDPYCTQEAKLDKMTMPSQDLTVYAGWNVIWYVVSIDPNYGELNPLNSEGIPTGTGSTWFWNSIDREPIAEYTYVERNYVESSSGTFYYVYHPGNGKGDTVWPDRFSYYTTDPGKSTEDTTFEYSPDTYTYEGWYEVNEDGTETPYVFGEHTDHNTKLKLHWKKSGVYYLAYDAGEGTLENGQKTILLPDRYSDYSNITLTKSAVAPTGKTFIGWKIRGSKDSRIYTAGQVFTLLAANAKRVSGKDVIYLDAVYMNIGTASIVYKANGGSVLNTVDFGQVPGETGGWEPASGAVNIAEGTATVPVLGNNSKFKLSNGNGFLAPEGSNAAFLGWSDKSICDESAAFYSKDSDDIYGVTGATTLYAVWGARVTYNLNSNNAEWGVEWDPTIYTLDGDVYYQTANIGTVVSEPVNVPVYTGAEERLFRYWATRTGSGTDEDPYVYNAYDFSQQVAGTIDLYAYWGEANTITVHAVDASDPSLADRTGESGWTVNNVVVSATETALNANSHVTETPDNYEFAFVAVASDLNSVSDANEVTAVKYENKKVKVKYKGETVFRVLGEGSEFYFVYYRKKTLNIGYKSMDVSGVLDNATKVSGAPEVTDTLLGDYSMSEQLTAPLSLVEGDFTKYAFAIGEIDTGALMNASNLSLITNTASAGDPVPTLRIRNTWRGFEYTTQTGNNAVWTTCGYNFQLYAIYYTKQPTVVMFDEITLGTNAVMDTEFEFNLLVTQVTRTVESVQTQKKEGDIWSDYGDPVITENTSDPIKIFDTTDPGNSPYILKNGEANSAILFFSSSTGQDDPVIIDETTRTVKTTTVTDEQTVVITQTANPSFTTSINGTVQESEPYQYTYTATGLVDTQNATFTNAHKSLPVEVHVAMVESDGYSGGIVQRDNTYRTTTVESYKFDLALGASEVLLTRLPSNAVFTGDTDTYAFGAVLSGTGSEDAVITIENMGIVSIGYAPISDNVYELVLKDSDGNIIGELGNSNLYYLYYPKARIRYVKEEKDGSLTDITGCLENPSTGVIEPSKSVTYSHNLLTMNGTTVEQNQSFEIPMTGFVISQEGNNFRMPPELDDDLHERYLSYVKLGAGNANATDISELDTSDKLTMQLSVQNNTLQYSFDGIEWKDLPLAGSPTIYAIYSERGYDLQISKTVDISKSGEDPIFRDSSFTVTIRSTAITKDSYEAEGAESESVEATPAEGSEPGVITFTVVDGTRVRIKGLGWGDYTITEAGNENYTLTAKSGPIAGGSTTPMVVEDNSTVSFTLDTETKVDLTNSPKAICKIGDQYFYTLNKMVAYVDEYISTKTATAEMLTDYYIPAADIVEIPTGFNLTLTTADIVGHVAVITRTEELSDVSLFTNNGTFSISNLVLEGNNIEATAPMIQSAGDLTIGSGASIQNIEGGGAIIATDGDITVSGTIQHCKAAVGGAIYHSGNSNITVSGTGAITNNEATEGYGGAIYLQGGSIKLSGTSRISSNKAEAGNGGAIYTGNAEIDIDQGASITGNTAKDGGAIYAEIGTIVISETEGAEVKPSVTGNTSTTGNGGAIHIGAGSVTISGGSVSTNKAENGKGGAIYANTATVTILDKAIVNSNRSNEGGAVYAEYDAVSVSGGSVKSNFATTSGGAIYTGSGNVTVSGGDVSGNNAETGGAIYTQIGNVTISGGVMSSNTAGTDGGAVYSQSGMITGCVPEEGPAPTIQENKATNGKGGAFYAGSGAVSITGITLSKNKAGTDGGAVYAHSGAVSIINCFFGGDEVEDGNTAGEGGALYAGSSAVTISGGILKNNKSTGGNGGALYIGSGIVTVSGYTQGETTTYTLFSGNSAASGNGGAVYLDTGSIFFTSSVVTNNNAINGAAVFANSGRVSFTDGSYTANTASNGGAVGVGSIEARLSFSGNVQVKDNKLGTAQDAPKSNVYLDQDDDAIINIDTLGASASIGIHVPDTLVPTRSVPGARFAVYSSNSNVNMITNDRYPSLTTQSDTAAKKLYWGNGVRVEVMYLGSYANGLPNGTNRIGSTVKYINPYYPIINSDCEVALSDMTADIYTKYSDVRNGLKNYPNATFGGAFYYNASDYSYDISKLVWSTEEEQWQVQMRNGTTEILGDRRIYIIYSEPAYISIENNTEKELTISDLKLTVNGSDVSVVNNTEAEPPSAGYGMIFAKNGAIRTALLPIKASDLKLAAGQSLSLLIPGGQNMSYKLDGKFAVTEGGTVRLRRGEETSLSEESVTVSATGTFNQLTGNVLNNSKTYNVIFGDDKIVCKVVDSEGEEHPYSKISYAIEAIKTEAITLTTPKKATIEMVTDYLLTASDLVNIPQSFDITLTTAAKEGAKYCYNGSGDRATISRDTMNTNSMIKSWRALEADKVVTTLRLNNLIIDGKSVRGTSDGGAVATQYTNVYIDSVDFKNVYASNGGALLVMFNFDSVTTKNPKHTVQETILEVKNSDFTGCTSTTTVTSNRLGGGAIVTNAETMTLDTCDFIDCNAVDQAGAVFHRIDYNDLSWTNVNNCTFTNCQADAAGGLEIDSKTITVTNSVFNHCVAKKRNGGGFNVWALNESSGTPSADCWVTVRGCTFNDCQLTTTDTSRGNGGGFRSNAVYNVVENCTFTNNYALYGGGFCLSNGNAKTCEIKGCSFQRNTANQGGGAYVKAYDFSIGDTYYYTNMDDEVVYVKIREDGSFEDLDGNVIDEENILNRIQIRHTEIRNCTANNEGGGVYHDKNANNSSLTVTNATISNNQTKNSSKNGGGIFTNCRTVSINGSTINENTCTNYGGGVYAYSYTSLTINDSEISGNIASSNGGGVWFDANDENNRNKQVLTIKGSKIDGNTSSNGNGGGFYTLAKTVTIRASDSRIDTSGNPIRSSISNNTAKTNGGGLYQLRSVNGSKLEISNTDINRNISNNTNTNTDNGGGGIYAGVRTLTIMGSSISGNTARSHGGGVLFEINDDNARNAMVLSVKGCTIESNIAGGNGGGIYTKAKTAMVTALDAGESGATVPTPTRISGCTANSSGGGIYQIRNVDGSSLTITGSVIKDCISNDTNTGWDHGGGGVFGYVHAVTVTGSQISGNSAKGKGGGLCMGPSSDTYMLTVDSTMVTGNTSSNQGGGIATSAQLTLRNGTMITGNRLTSNDSANCAGVYLVNNRTLFVGPEDATEDTTDTIIVRNNTTAHNTLSDLRLWEANNENHSSSVYIYCHLSEDSEIRVVNAAKVSTWFGSSKYSNRNGFSDAAPVFKADNSTLHGIYNREDSTKTQIIWAGPPIAKITDGAGNLLYMKFGEDSALYPAIFDRLDTGKSEGSTVSPFSFMRLDNFALYELDGTLYEGPDYSIKMLVEQYETAADMALPNKPERNVTFTTAGKNDADYPYNGKEGGRAIVTRGFASTTQKPLINVDGNLIIENLVLDGGSENGIGVSDYTRCIRIGSVGNATLGTNAILQNGRTTQYGGGVYVNGGTLRVAGGIIRDCSAKDGGGVCVAAGNNSTKGRFTLTAGSIYNCTATNNGGGVCQTDGTFTMTGGTISNGSAANSGGGIYVANGKSFNMLGGSVINNHAVTAGGGIAIGGANTRLYFSGKVNISGNTSDASLAIRKACNVELNQSTYEVIHTNNRGLYPGAYIGVYVAGEENTQSHYDKHGVERKPFGMFENGDNTTNFYSFVNDRNGLKGGIIEETDPDFIRGKNCIYWIQIFSLNVSKEIVSGNSTTADENEMFLFKVMLHGYATVTGQLDASQIDSSTGYYGEMQFTSNGVDSTTAVFALKSKEGENTITGVNLSEGLEYDVIEYLTVDQAVRYASMPMQNHKNETEELTVDGITYTVIQANVYSSKIGENKDRTDVDPYTSALTFSNMMPVCKITDMNGNLLYRDYNWNKITNKSGEGPDGGDKVIQPLYKGPAVFTELAGDNGAFKALDGYLYTYVDHRYTVYDVSNGVMIQMLIGDYSQRETITFNKSKVTLTTASSNDALFPKQDAGTVSTIRRAFDGTSMFTIDNGGDLTYATVILDGMKGTYTINKDGGIANVKKNGSLTIQTGAVLQNSRTDEDYKGGAVYVAEGGSATVTGGTINRNESVGNGAGIYLEEGSTVNLSGNPSFGGSGLDVGGNITYTNGNFKTEELVAKLNGGKNYTKARQDIYIAGYQSDSDTDTSAASLVVNGNITSGDGTIWVWAEESPHYKTLKQFAKYTSDVTDTITTLAAFRNAKDDVVTEANQVGQYLHGITKADDSNRNVFWYGIEGSAHVMLVKVLEGTSSYTPYPDQEFTVYTDKGKNNIAKGTILNVDGSEEVIELKDLKSGDGGAFFIGELSFGTYYVVEKGKENQYFEITIDEGGVVEVTNPTTNPKETKPVKTVTLES